MGISSKCAGHTKYNGHYNVLQCITMYYNVLQCITMYYNVLCLLSSVLNIGQLMN